MATHPAVFPARTGMNEQKMIVSDLVHRVESLMNDGRYPPLHNQKVNLTVPFLIKHRRD
jgi:hypothetical protein